LTFAAAVERIRDGDSGHSRVPSNDRDKFAAERLLPKLTNWHCRPIPVIQVTN